jgi:hypothetical protein
MFSHFTREVRENLVLIVQLHAKHGAGQNRRNGALNFDWLFVSQNFLNLSLLETVPSRFTPPHSVWKGIGFG